MHDYSIADTSIPDRLIASFKTAAVCFKNAYKLIKQE